jgi:hypothetical protein
MTANSNTPEQFSHTGENTMNIDSTRGNLLTDIQASVGSVPMPSTVTQLALNDTTHHDISSILTRPVNLGTFEWNSSDPPIPIQITPTDFDADTPNFLQKFDFPQAIFNASPITVDKLKNYQYFKSDIEFEVKVNAQPFLQGALMAVHNPYISKVGDFRRKGTRFLASQTSCPYKIISLEESNSLKLTIPYANIYDMFDLNNSDNQFGTIFLYVFSSLRGTGVEEKVKYTVFARFVNPDYKVPTHNDVISAARNAFDIKRLESQGMRVAQADVAPVAATDSGESSTAGPVSTVAHTVSTISDALSGVPVLGQIASTVGWVSRTVGNLATTFGWSKPVSIQPKCVLKPTSALIHTEGQDDAVTLALLQDNGIDGSSFIPEDKDEMALSYVLGRPNYFHAQTISQEAFSGNKLMLKWEVSPLSQYQYGNAEDSATMYMGSFAYASMLASFWRGAINYDIMVVKTGYHLGRFAVVFLPETNLDEVPPTLGTLLSTNYIGVYDLKEVSTLKLSVPFFSNTPWRETYKRSTNESNPGPDATTLDTKTGCIAIYSLIDMSSPPTVASDITFYVAHSAGNDYQLGRPRLNLAPGFQSRYAQSDIGAVVIPSAESMLVPSHTSRDVTAQTTGEYFTSLRALIKRFGHLCDLSQDANFVGLRTRHMAENSSSGAREMSRLNFSDRVFPTPFYAVSLLYRFYNGSSQLKVIPYTPGVVADSFLDYDEDLTDQVVVPANRTIGQPVFSQLQQVSNAFEIRSPFYRGVRGDVVNSTQVPVLVDVRTFLRCRNNANYGGDTQTSQVYEAAGDDFSFYFMVGPPPMCDIRNLQSDPIALPTGSSVEVDFSGVTDVSATGGTLVALPVTYTPPLAVSPVSAGIASSSLQFVTVTYTDATTQDIPVTSCQISPVDGFSVPVNSAKTVDAPATLAFLNTIDVFTVVTNASLA